jgi:hypothetical protein
MELLYKRRFGADWHVTARFMDMANKGERLHFRSRGMPDSWPVGTRDREMFITILQNLHLDDRMAIDTDTCSTTVMELEIWQKDEKGREVHANSHAPSAAMYMCANVEALESRGAMSENRRLRPVASREPSDTGQAVSSEIHGQGQLATSRGNSHHLDGTIPAAARRTS